MVVHEDDSRSILHDRGAEDLAGMNQGGIENAPRDLDIGQYAMLGIQQKCMEFLVREIPQPGPHEAEDIGRPPNVRPFGQAFFRSPAAEFQCCKNAGRSRPPDPGQAFEVGRSVRSQGPQAATGGSQNPIGYAKYRLAADPGAQDEREEFGK